jgi:hypothetical protein
MDPLPDLSKHFHFADGFCYPDWESISDVIDSLDDASAALAWEAAERSWFEHLKHHLGHDYHIHESRNFLLLSPAPQRVVTDALETCENALADILHHLPGVANGEGLGKQNVIMLAEAGVYYSYLSHFYPEGESPMNGGVCLSTGRHLHFVLPTPDYSSYRSTLVHELTHVCLSHLGLPLWLEEALAMRMEEVICHSSIFHLDSEIVERHHQHWNSRSIQEFWNGRAWQIPGDSFELAYNLAQILWRKIEGDLGAPRPAILEFLAQARFEDGGETAFIQAFDLNLGELAADFLGEGDWRPAPALWD